MTVGQSLANGVHFAPATRRGPIFAGSGTRSGGMLAAVFNGPVSNGFPGFWPRR